MAPGQTFVRILRGVALILLLLSCQGCLDLMYKYGPYLSEFERIPDQLSRTYTNVEIQVLDADTLQPIPGATVGVNNDPDSRLLPDDNSTRVTDRQGKVSLRVVQRRSPAAHAYADGYMRTRDAETPLGWLPLPTKVIHIYRLPRPYHVLEVPVGFEGTLEARIPVSSSFSGGRPTPDQWPGWQPGERAMVTRLEANSLAQMLPLPDMGDSSSDSMAIGGARFSDGTPLPLWYHSRFASPPPQAGPTTQPVVDRKMIAMWDLGYRAGLYHRFYVGTLEKAYAAQEEWRQQVEASEEKRRFYFSKLPPREESSPTTSRHATAVP